MKVTIPILWAAGNPGYFDVWTARSHSSHWAIELSEGNGSIWGIKKKNRNKNAENTKSSTKVARQDSQEYLKEKKTIEL